jgi:plastocyanin domain-containing protein
MLVVVLGIFMFQNGLGLSGFGFNTLPSVQASSQSAAEMLKDVTIENGVQIVRSTVRSDSYDPITVQAGLPVRWTLVAEEGAINGCNNRIVIPAYDIEQPLAVGETVIEFTPEKAGNVAFSCWMGMIRSQIKVVAATTANPSTTANDASKTSADASLPASNDLAGTTASGTNPDESDAIQTAVIADNQQTATIQITASGYSPQVLVVQRGVPLKLTLDVQQIAGCNNPLSIRPVVPGGSNDQNLTLDLKKNQTIPEFIPQDDFIVSCWMGMLTTYVKVVDDLGSVDPAAIQDEVANSPALTGGCCAIG